MNELPSYVCITGATGFLGHYILAELLRTGRNCAIFVRGDSGSSKKTLISLLRDLGCDAERFLQDHRLVIAPGDLHNPPDFSDLPIESLLHVAACTNFRADSRGEPHLSNVIGTQCLLEWASKRGIRDLHYVSSAYSCGRATHPVTEKLHHSQSAFHNDYEQSKQQAEQLCDRWAGENDATLTIYRPSVIVGEFATGRSTRFAGFYLSARSTEFLSRSFENASPEQRLSIPLRIRGRAEDCQNIVPVDYVAPAIAAAINMPQARSRIYHLTHPNPPSNGAIKAAFEAYFEIGGGCFVEPHAFPVDGLNEHEQRFYEISRSIEHYFVDTPTFLRDNTAWIDARAGIYCPSYGCGDIARLIAYAQAAGWGRTPRGIDARASNDESSCRPYFESFLPARIADSQVARETAVSATVRFIIEDDPCGEWVCGFEQGRLAELHSGANGVREDFGYRCNREVFCEAIAGRVHPQEAFLDGRAEIFGDTERALKMAMILHEFNRECPYDVRSEK